MVTPKPRGSASERAWRCVPSSGHRRPRTSCSESSASTGSSAGRGAAAGARDLNAGPAGWAAVDGTAGPARRPMAGRVGLARPPVQQSPAGMPGRWRGAVGARGRPSDALDDRQRTEPSRPLALLVQLVHDGEMWEHGQHLERLRPVCRLFRRGVALQVQRVQAVQRCQRG